MDEMSLNYREYLKGDHWRQFRAWVLRIWPRCAICRGKATCVHHKTYLRIGGEWPDDVESLCAQCHDLLHVAHREHRIPWDQFERAAGMIDRLNPKRKGRKKKRVARHALVPSSAPSPDAIKPLSRNERRRRKRKKERKKERRRLRREGMAPVQSPSLPNTSAPPSSKLMSRIDEVIALMVPGYTTIGIVFRLGYPHDEVKAVVSWIEATFPLPDRPDLKTETVSVLPERTPPPPPGVTTMSHPSPAAPLARRHRAEPNPPGPFVVEFVRACGHSDRFEHAPGYLYAETKRARLASKLCPACRQAKQLELEQAQRAESKSGTSGKIKKGQEAKALPIGTRISFVRLDDGSWSATISAAGIVEESTSPGLMGLAAKVARKWLRSSGRNLTGQVKP